MGGRRLPALAAVTLLLAATAATNGPPEVPLVGEGQSPEPPRLEASGETVTSLGTPGSPPPPDPRDPQIGGGSSPESGSDSDPRPGPLPHGRSSESEEGL
nr:translation initiation factor IF-2-like isoform X2 [Taeniopygia guttata]